MPKVMNLKRMVADDWLADTLYIGRPGKFSQKILAAHCEMRDGTALGNPFKVGNYADPPDCILDYRRYLDGLIRPKRWSSDGAAARQAIDLITESTILVCWCKPGPCHGDVIIRAWKWWQNEQINGCKET